MGTVAMTVEAHLREGGRACSSVGDRSRCDGEALLSAPFIAAKALRDGDGRLRPSWDLLLLF